MYVHHYFILLLDHQSKVLDENLFLAEAKTHMLESFEKLSNKT